MKGKEIDKKYSEVVEKEDRDEIKIAYNGKQYTLDEAVSNGLMKSYYKREMIELKTDEERDYDLAMKQATRPPEMYRVLRDGVSFIKGKCQIQLKKRDEIHFKVSWSYLHSLHYFGNIEKLHDIKLKDRTQNRTVIVNDKMINLNLDTISYINFDKKHQAYIELPISGVIETKTQNGQSLFLTKTIIVDKETGNIVKGYLCEKNNKDIFPSDFSCEMNGNRIDIKDQKSNGIVMIKDGKIAQIMLGIYQGEKPKITYNGKEIFFPDSDGSIQIAKIDDSILDDGKKHSGVNFYFKALDPKTIISKTDIDGKKYINGGDILNYTRDDTGKKLRQDKEFDITYYDDGTVLSKSGNDAKTAKIISFEKIAAKDYPEMADKDCPLYQVNTQYHLNSYGWTLHSEHLAGDEIREWLNETNSHAIINNTSIKTANLSKAKDSNGSQQGFEKK